VTDDDSVPEAMPPGAADADRGRFRRASDPSAWMPDDNRARRRLVEATTELPAFLTGQLDVVRGDVDEADIDAERESTVQALMQLGVPEADARTAVTEDRVALVLAAQVLDETPVYSLDRLSRKAGVSGELLSEVLTTMGVAVPERFTRQDLEMARNFADLVEVVRPESILRSARARGLAVRSIVGADMEVVREELILPLRQAGADDITVAVALAEAMKALAPIAEELLISAYRMHLRALLQSEISHMAARGTESALILAVGFVDLVGYTSLAGRIDPAGLDAVLELFESRVLDVVASDSDVGVVKYLGDAAMLIAPNAARLAPIMIELVAEQADMVDVPIKGGMATGEVLIREGDYFGSPVNLAARLTDAARPWRVLADEESGQQLANAGFRTQRTRPMRLRGIGSVRPVVLLDLPSAAADTESE